MDRTHAEFVSLIRALGCCVDEDVPGRLGALAAHCRQHFDEEHALMDRHGFPSGDCHKEEHAAVLGSVREVLALEDPARQCATARRLAQSLCQWFEAHLTYMDSALAHWVSRRELGGVPIVLRRGLPPAPRVSD